MAATSGFGTRLQGSRATVTGADNSLESINTFELDDGAIVIIISNFAQYLLNKASVAAPSGDDIVAPAQGGPGRWFKYPVGGGGGSSEPLSNILFADLDTIVPLADQNGAIVLPFSTAEVLVAEVEVLASTGRTGYLTPGDYSTNQIDIEVSARYAAFAPTYEGIRQDRRVPTVLLDLNPTDDITLRLWGINLPNSLTFPSNEGELEGELFLEDCQTVNLSVFDIAAVNTEFNDATELNFGRGFMKDCSVSSDAPTAITISEDTFMMLGMAFNTNHSITFLNAAGVITVDETTAAAMVAASVTVVNGTVVVLELEHLSNMYYVDGGTLVPTYLQNGAQGMPYNNLDTALDTVLPVAVGRSTFLITPGDYLTPLTATASCNLQGIANVTSLGAPVLNFVSIAALTISADQIVFLSDVRILGTTTVGADATMGFTDCSMGVINGGNVQGENSGITGNVSSNQISLSTCLAQGTLTAVGTISLTECLLQNDLTAATINLTRCTFAGAILITGDVSTDWQSYQNAIAAGVGFVGAMVFTDYVSGAMMFEATAATNTFATAATTNLVAVTGNAFAQRFIRVGFAFTAAGCIVTYGGSAIPTLRCLVTVTATIVPAASDVAAQTHSLAISFNGDLIGADPATTFTGGIQRPERIATSGESITVSVQRVVEVTDTDTIQPIGAYSDTENTDIIRLTMTIEVL